MQASDIHLECDAGYLHVQYLSLEELQADLDAWLAYYNNERPHQGKMCCGRTPLQTLIAGKEV